MWQDQVSEIMVKVNVKLTEFQVMQMIATSFLVEPPTVDLVNTARECVDQMTWDIAGLQETYTQFSTKLWEVVIGNKDDTGGSRTSHK